MRISPKASEKPDESRNSRPPKAMLFSVWMIQNCMDGASAARFPARRACAEGCAAKRGPREALRWRGVRLAHSRSLTPLAACGRARSE